jgi:hypothetical protein
MFEEKEKPLLFHDVSFSIPPSSPSVIISPVNISPVVTNPTTVSSPNIPPSIPVSASPPSSHLPSKKPKSKKPKVEKPKIEKPKVIPFNHIMQSKQDKFNHKMSQLETIHHLQLQTLTEKAEMLGRFKFEEKREKKELQREKTRISTQLKEEEEFEKFEQQLLLQQSKLTLAEEKIETKKQIADIQLFIKEKEYNFMFDENEKTLLFHDVSFSIPPSVISFPPINISPIVTNPTTVSSPSIPPSPPPSISGSTSPPSSPKTKAKKPKVEKPKIEKPKAIPFNQVIQSKQDKFKFKM